MGMRNIGLSILTSLCCSLPPLLPLLPLPSAPSAAAAAAAASLTSTLPARPRSRSNQVYQSPPP